MSNSVIFYVGIVLAVIGVLIGIASFAHIGIELGKKVGGGLALVVLLVGVAVAWYGRRAQAAT